MVDVKTDVQTNPRQAQRDERDRRMKLVSAASEPIKVLAANEDMRRLLKHPAGKVAFRKLDQAVEWPNDQFTMRRLADGSIYREGETAPAASREADEKQSLRERAAARRPQKTEAQQTEARPAEATGKRPETPRDTPSEPKPAA